MHVLIQNHLILFYHFYLLINFVVLNHDVIFFLNGKILWLIIFDINKILLNLELKVRYFYLNIFLNQNPYIQKLNIIFFLHELNLLILLYFDVLVVLILKFLLLLLKEFLHLHFLILFFLMLHNHLIFYFDIYILLHMFLLQLFRFLNIFLIHLDNPFLNI